MTRERWGEARRVLGEGPRGTKAAWQRARVLSDWERRRGRRPLRALGWGLGVAAAAAALLVFFLPRPVVRDDDGPIAVGAPLLASAPRVLRFSEGSQVTLAPATRAHLDTVNERQVDLVLEEGLLEASVAKGTGRTWRYRAGPWTVRVVGTRLTIRWTPASAAVEVSVSEGAVEVSGPGLASPVLVRAGQRLTRATPPPLPEEELQVEMDAPVVAAASREDAGDDGAGPPRGPTPAPLPRQRRVDCAGGDCARREAEQGEAPWRPLLATGRRREALAAAAGALSTPGALAEADALALGDAARLERDLPLARRLFGALLAREGGATVSPELGAEAAFLLGRLETDARQLPAAVAAFRRSLALAPSGSSSEQARGRLLEALLELDDGAGAAAIAAESLHHHPAGAWAGLARRVLGQDGGR